MKHRIDVYPFAFNKIVSGRRKIDIRLYKKRMRDIRVGDMIEYVNIQTNNITIKEVNGIALFKDFKSLIRSLSHEMIGYGSTEEVRLRIERMYPKEEQIQYGVCALFIDEPEVVQLNKVNYFERSA